ncbi:MAG: helix-turn-helix domain-containing protein, partial [Pseudomonadota bacterium]
LRRALDHRALVLQNRAYRDVLENRQSDADVGTLPERLEAHEREIIERALSDANGRVSEAAAKLGVPRNTLYDRMTRLRVVAKSFRT